MKSSYGNLITEGGVYVVVRDLHARRLHGHITGVRATSVTDIECSRQHLVLFGQQAYEANLQKAVMEVAAKSNFNFHIII